MTNNYKSEARIVLVTFPNLEVARQIGTLLVEAQLIACINLLPGVESIYRWEGKVHIDPEVLGILKTTLENLQELKALVLEKHPYQTPEFLVLEPSEGSERYLNWVMESCRRSI